VAGQRPADADVFVGIASARIDMIKIPLDRRDIIMVEVVVAGGDDIGLHIRDGVTQSFAEGIHQHPRACLRCQEKTGLSEPFELHEVPPEFLPMILLHPFNVEW